MDTIQRCESDKAGLHCQRILETLRQDKAPNAQSDAFQKGHTLLNVV